MAMRSIELRPQFELADFNELVGGVGLVDRARAKDDRRHAKDADRGRVGSVGSAHPLALSPRVRGQVAPASRRRTVIGVGRPVLFMKRRIVFEPRDPEVRVLGDVSHQIGKRGGRAFARANPAVDADRGCVGHGVDADAAFDRRHAHGRTAAERMGFGRGQFLLYASIAGTTRPIA